MPGRKVWNLDGEAGPFQAIAEMTRLGGIRAGSEPVEVDDPPHSFPHCRRKSGPIVLFMRAKLLTMLVLPRAMCDFSPIPGENFQKIACAHGKAMLFWTSRRNSRVFERARPRGTCQGGVGVI